MKMRKMMAAVCVCVTLGVLAPALGGEFPGTESKPRVLYKIIITEHKDTEMLEYYSKYTAEVCSYGFS